MPSLKIRFLPTYFDDESLLSIEEKSDFLTAFSVFAGVIGSWKGGRFPVSAFPESLYVHEIPQAKRLVKYDVWAFAWPEFEGRKGSYRCTFHLVDLDPVTGYPIRVEIRRVGTHAIYSAP